MTACVSASAIIAASPDEVFRIVTDISRLPEWNAAITAVLERPDRLEVGSRWIVEMHALGRTWHSRSELETLDPLDLECGTLDPLGRRFAYRSASDDGNPSYALWTWIVADHPDGALVTVAGELHPRTFWRRVLLVRIRSRQLAHTELKRSLAALGSVAKRRKGPADGLAGTGQADNEGLRAVP